jgi:succinylglutamate desuccinylase
VDEEKERIVTADTAPLYLKKELTQLLRSGQLPLAIVLSEILGPPRALKPVKRRSYTMHRCNK